MNESTKPRPRGFRRGTKYRHWPKKPEGLLALIVQFPLPVVAKRLGRTLVAVSEKVHDLGGIRKLALDGGLVDTGRLVRLLRKRSRSTIAKWRGMGLAYRELGGGDWRGNKPASRPSFFYRLADVRDFLTANPRLLILLDPDARRLLRLELGSPVRPPRERRVLEPDSSLKLPGAGAP